MITALISRVVILCFGTLYPAYASYKAVKSKDVREYVRWMMYWIVFAMFTSAEVFTDVFLSFWFPFYYELKILLVLWLLSPVTKGSSILYRHVIHPLFTKREKEIDEYIAKAKDQGYSVVMDIGSKGFSMATNALMTTAIKGGNGIFYHIRKSYSLNDLHNGNDQNDSAGNCINTINDLNVRKRHTMVECARNLEYDENVDPNVGKMMVSAGSQVDLSNIDFDTPVSCPCKRTGHWKPKEENFDDATCSVNEEGVRNLRSSVRKANNRRVAQATKSNYEAVPRTKKHGKKKTV